MKTQTINLDFIKVIKYYDGKENVLKSFIVDNKNTPVINQLLNGEIKDYIEGDVDICSLNPETILVTTLTSSILIFNKGSKVDYHIIYQFKDEREKNFDKMPAYYLDNFLLKNNRIILREDGLYGLFDISSGKRLSALYHVITVIDNLIIAEIYIENDTLVGDLSLDGILIDHVMTSQKYNAEIKISGKASSSPTSILISGYPRFTRNAERKRRKKGNEKNFLF